MTTPKSVQLQGALTPDQGLCPWTPLGAEPPNPHYRLALRARHMPPNLYSWIRPCTQANLLCLVTLTFDLMTPRIDVFSIHGAWTMSTSSLVILAALVLEISCGKTNRRTNTARCSAHAITAGVSNCKIPCPVLHSLSFLYVDVGKVVK